MTRIDFYVVEGAAAAHDRVICRVVEKAWQQGHEVYLNCADARAAQAFDELLWHFRDTSFVPHGLAGDGGAPMPVTIGTDINGVAAPDVLVNLASDVPAEVSRFTRVIESAGHDGATREAARGRYRFYQERGFPLHTHKVAG